MMALLSWNYEPTSKWSMTMIIIYSWKTSTLLFSRKLHDTRSDRHFLSARKNIEFNNSCHNLIQTIIITISIVWMRFCTSSISSIIPSSQNNDHGNEEYLKLILLFYGAANSTSIAHRHSKILQVFISINY